MNPEPHAVAMLCAGGDWGSAITTALGGLYPQHCRAIHVNMCFARPSYTNPWHLAQILNAKLPLANWFPLAISYQASSPRLRLARLLCPC